MGASLRKWWQQTKQHPSITSGIIVAFLFIVFILSAYLFGWSGTGFLNKSLWDWLQLLIIPLALAVIALLFQLANTRTERQIAKERYEQDQQIALDKQREDLLQAYLDRMSELLLKEKLRSSEDDAEVRNVARVRTITILFQLDARRIGYVFAFLREAGLMSNKPNGSIVSLSQAYLRTINWSQANLHEANLSQADLRGAILVDADLRGVNLSQANLSQANLSGAVLLEADLSGANLGKAILSKINLSQANLGKANLSEADLSGALLVDADLSEAFLYKANLRNANLRRAILVGAHLLEADLSGANLAQTNLSKAYSLQGATMPDGTTHS